MEVELRKARKEDRAAVEALLRARELPLEGLAEHFATFWVAEGDGKVVGSAGLEVHGRHGLLRSLCVESDLVGAGIGSRLTWQMLEEAVSLGLREVFLVTASASEFFPRFGFVRLRRREMPADLQASREIAACPPTATAMRWSPTASGIFEPPSVI